MINQNYTVLIPAYGRDYKSKALVIQDFIDGVDFKMPLTGQYTSIRDIRPGTKINLRYRKLAMVTIHTV